MSILNWVRFAWQGHGMPCPYRGISDLGGDWVPRCASGLAFGQRGKMPVGRKLGLFRVIWDGKAGRIAAIRRLGSFCMIAPRQIGGTCETDPKLEMADWKRDATVGWTWFGLLLLFEGLCSIVRVLYHIHAEKASFYRPE